MISLRTMNATTALISLCLVVLVNHSLSFVIQPSSPFGRFTTTVTSTTVTSTTSKTPTTVRKESCLFAKRKRRRRADAPKKNKAPSTPAPTTSTPKANDDLPPVVLGEEDELPDFDLIEDIDLPTASTTEGGSSSIGTSASTSTSSTPASSSKTVVTPAMMKKKTLNLDDPSVIDAMKATKSIETMGSNLSSTKDLLRSRDRELEQKLVVDEIVQDVPSFADYNAKKSTSTNRPSGANSGYVPGQMGKKAMRREERRAAALKAEGDMVEDGPNPVDELIKKLPFVDDSVEKEEKSLIKLLEEGTWACIYLLVGWEIYINTPLFNRAAPMAPVVFQDPVTMTFLL